MMKNSRKHGRVSVVDRLGLPTVVALWIAGLYVAVGLLNYLKG